MNSKRIVSIVATMCFMCAAGTGGQSSLAGSNKSRSKMFLDARAPLGPTYTRSEIKTMIHAAKTPEDLERLAEYFDAQEMEFHQKSDDQLKELQRLLALPHHSRSYATQVENTRALIKKYKSKALECAARASEYRDDAARQTR